jgi:hypothetical protein
MTQDRAAAVATTLIAILARCLRSADVRNEVAEVLREEFHDIQPATLREMRPDDPPD